MPAFGAAVAMGAQEIEFDLWYTKDGEIVSIHDSKLDRVSDGTGKVYDHTYQELLQYDFGIKRGKEFAGMRILRFEEILEQFSCQVIMNIHIKTVSNDVSYDPALLQKIIDLIYKYDAQNHVYFMTGNDLVMAQLRDMAPDIRRCMGAGGGRWEIVERAIRLDCHKVQLFKPYFDQAMIDKAHENKLICNVFFADDEKTANEYLDMGVDVILTNDYHRIADEVAKREKYVTY
jgi:glycerophosphoryl diester phosphodiesterase